MAVSKLQSKLASQPQDNSPNLIIEARAGTGKTTTLVEGLKLLLNCPSDHPASKSPSPQQRAVWDALMLSKGKAKSICFAAFNSSIAKELQTRVPKGCDAMTMHSMGYKAVRQAFGNVRVESHRIETIVCDTLGVDAFELRKEHGNLLQATKKLTELCKMNLTPLEEEGALSALASHYDVETEGLDMEGVTALVSETLEQCKEMADGCIDFGDMIWLPVALDLPVFRYDLLLVDEAQDMNRCQQALAKKAGKRLILCGDPKQAIYGFAGADSESMDRMYEELNSKCCRVCNKDYDCKCGTIEYHKCDKLPLTVTRRCGKAIVKEANKIVADFHAFDTNPEGKVHRMRYDGGITIAQLASKCICEGWESKDNCPAHDMSNVHYQSYCKAGDMVLCRVNAPLVSQCFRFLKEGRKAVIRGRDIGQNLISTVTKMMSRYEGSEPMPELVSRLGVWLSEETKKENKKKHPDETKLIALQDRHDCLICFTDGCKTINDIIAKIESIFTDDDAKSAIMLSSVHKAKGLESHRVFFLMPKGAECPHPMARSEWQVEQEMNLKYVGVTRAIDELIFVS